MKLLREGLLNIAKEAQEDAAYWSSEVLRVILDETFYTARDLADIARHTRRAQHKAARAAKTARECMGLED